MSDNDMFYEEQLIKLLYFPSDYSKRILLIRLIRDVYLGYKNEKMIFQVHSACGVSKESWNSLLYAYKMFKEYQEISEKEATEQAVN